MCGPFKAVLVGWLPGVEVHPRGGAGQSGKAAARHLAGPAGPRGTLTRPSPRRLLHCPSVSQRDTGIGYTTARELSVPRLHGCFQAFGCSQTGLIAQECSQQDGRNEWGGNTLALQQGARGMGPGCLGGGGKLRPGEANQQKPESLRLRRKKGLLPCFGQFTDH